MENEQDKTKTYLGDYAEIEDGMIKLYTSDGRGEIDVIYLEPEVYRALKEFVARFYTV